MPTGKLTDPSARKPSRRSSDLFIVDNSDDQLKAARYLHDWCDIARSMDVATGFFEIGALLALEGQWQKLDGIRILMGHFHELEKALKQPVAIRLVLKA